MTRLWDAHMHTSFSGDCQTPPEDMILKAKELNLPGITFTDHLDWDYKEEPGLFDLDLDAYRNRIQKLQQQYTSENFQILWGIELGLQPHLAPRHRKLLESYPFDFVIGSSHVVHSVDPYYPSYFEDRAWKDSYREYYCSILENIQSFDDFDSYGHLDYVFRYGPEGSAKDTYTDYADLVDTILKELIRHDKALEINTGAYRCGMTKPNPSQKIIKRYYDLGGRLITIGADAHKTEHVGLNFPMVGQLLYNIGFREYYVYKKRQPAAFPLTD